MVELIAKWKEASRKLEAQLGVPPTAQQLAEFMQLPVRKIRIIRRAVKAFQTPTTGAADADGELVSMGDLIADAKGPAPEEATFQNDEVVTLTKLLDSIDVREAQILRLRFGLDGQEPLTLKEIADSVGISRERVRQIVDESLTKLNAQISDDRPSRFFKENLSRQGEPLTAERSRERAIRRARRYRAIG
jgi:RNA polymerase primary sigma factor